MKSLIDDFKIIMPEAPFIIDDNNSRGWWELNSPMDFNNKHIYKQYDDTLKLVSKCLSVLVKGDELYVISFSQGAILAEILLINNLYPINPTKMIMFSPSGSWIVI